MLVKAAQAWSNKTAPKLGFFKEEKGLGKDSVDAMINSKSL